MRRRNSAGNEMAIVSSRQLSSWAAVRWPGFWRTTGITHQKPYDFISQISSRDGDLPRLKQLQGGSGGMRNQLIWPIPIFYSSENLLSHQLPQQEDTQSNNSRHRCINFRKS